MSVLDSITKARQMGATDDQIAQQIAAQNPDKATVFQTAKSKGANSSQIIDEIVKQNGGQSSPGTPAQPQQPGTLQGMQLPPDQQTPDSGLLGFDRFLQKGSNFLDSFLPGKALGDALGTSFATAQSWMRGDTPQATQSIANTPEDIGRAFADSANAMATPASMLVGGEGAAGVAKGVGIGAGTSALGAAANGGSASDIGTAALEGGALNLAGAGVGKLAEMATNWLPQRLVNSALPKLVGSSKEGMTDYVIDHAKVGSIASMLEDSTSNATKLGDQISHILTGPSLKAETGNIPGIFETAMAQFPESKYVNDTFIAAAHELAPEVSKLTDKIAEGTATLAEQNEVRQALDRKVYGKAMDTPQLSSLKKVGFAFSNALRANVQATAKETAPLFSDYSKELTLRTALRHVADKQAKASPLPFKTLLEGIAGGFGFLSSGPVGAAAGFAAAKTAESPAAKILAAKGLTAAGKAAPIVAPIATAARSTVAQDITK